MSKPFWDMIFVLHPGVVPWSYNDEREEWARRWEHLRRLEEEQLQRDAKTDELLKRLEELDIPDDGDEEEETP